MIHLRQTELLFIRCQICTRPILFLDESPLKNCIQFRSLLSFGCFAYFTLCSLLADLFVLLSLKQSDTRQRQQVILINHNQLLDRTNFIFDELLILLYKLFCLVAVKRIKFNLLELVSLGKEHFKPQTK